MINRKTLSILTVSCLALGVTACSREAEAPPQPVDEVATAEAPPAPQISYACESGRSLNVRYLDSSSAEIDYQNQTYVLQIARSASGARYAGSGLEWWTAARGDTENATLSRLGPNEEVGSTVLERCSRPASTVLPPAAPGEAGDDAVGLTVTDGPPPCRGPALSLARESGEGAAGSRFVTLSLTNEGAQPCSLTGHPGMELRDAQGRVIANLNVVEEAGAYYGAGRAPGPVALAPGAKAFFDLAYSAVPHEDIGETRCPSVARIVARAPADSADIPLDMTFQPCGRQVRVTPVRPVAEASRD